MYNYKNDYRYTNLNVINCVQIIVLYVLIQLMYNNYIVLFLLRFSSHSG